MISGKISKTSEVHTVYVITSGSVEKTYVLYTAGIVYIHYNDRFAVYYARSAETCIGKEV